MSFLVKIRQKPVYIRKILMVISIAICGGAVFVFWLHSFKNSVIQNPENAGTPRQQEAMPSLKEIVVSGVSDMIHIFQSGKKQLEELKKPTPESETSTNPKTTMPQPQSDVMPEITPRELP